MESITKKYELSDLLEHIKESTDISEESLTYISLNATKNKINEFYENMMLLSDEFFADTQSLENLKKRAVERGVSLKGSTNAYFRLVTNIDVPIGSRFALEDFTYIVTEKIIENYYIVMCEIKGSQANNIFGKVTPINFIHGLQNSVIDQMLIPARDEEDVESLRERYFDSFGVKPYGGNKKDYIDILNQIDSVYSCKIIRAGNGAGTVKIYILNNELNIPSDELIDSVKAELDPKEYEGYGEGSAPIGHIVYIEKPIKKAINIYIEIQTSLTDEEQIKNIIYEKISLYFAELNKIWHKEKSGIIVRISYLQDYILSSKHIIDILQLKLNGTNSNIKLQPHEIPSIYELEIHLGG